MDHHLDALRATFRSAPSKHAAHERAAALLADMGGDPSFVTAVLVRHFERGPGLVGRHYPVVSVMIESNPCFDLVMNCWLPLPDQATDVTTKAIHHHGTMLLSTATAFGPGYEHWTFARPRPTGEGDRFALDLLERGQHGLQHVAFVDEHVAHVPMYVPSLSITLALWSSGSVTTWRDRVKRIPTLQRRAPALRRLATAARLGGALELKNVEYFDFYPDDEGFVGMRERREFPRGPNADYVASLLHVVQQTGNDSLLPSIRAAAQRQQVDDQRLLEAHLRDLAAGNEIAHRLSEGHYGVPFANFSSAAIERSLAVRR